MTLCRSEIVERLSIINCFSSDATLRYLNRDIGGILSSDPAILLLHLPLPFRVYRRKYVTEMTS